MPLNERGVAQARAVGGVVCGPEAIYASPLARALTRRVAIARATGVAVVTSPALIEMDVGEMEHLAGAELRERYPEFLRRGFRRPARARMPGGETLRRGAGSGVGGGATPA